MAQKINPGYTAYTLEKIPVDLWEKFKKKVTKDKTLGEAIIELIKKEVEKK